MRSNLIIMFVVLFLSIMSCAHQAQIIQNESSSNKVKVARVGINGISTDKGFLIEKVSPKLPAASAGIKEGDLLLTVDNVKITSRKNFRHLIEKSVSSEREVEISLLRSGQPITIRLKPAIGELFPTINKIIDLAEDTKVIIAIVAGDVSNNLRLSPGFDKEDWKQSIRREMTSDLERTLLSISANNENLKLVDRSVISKIMDEFKFNESGFVSEDMRAKLGKMYGVTHIIICEFSRYPDQNGYVDLTHRKLINIQTGAVEAADINKAVKR
jgi:membrane-associated protease RseP (regulator of RpoE activity)